MADPYMQCSLGVQALAPVLRLRYRRVLLAQVQATSAGPVVQVSPLHRLLRAVSRHQNGTARRVNLVASG